MEFFQLTLDFMRHTSLFSTLSIKQCAKTASGSRTTSARKHSILKKSPHEVLRYTCSNYSLQFLYYNFDARHIPTDFQYDIHASREWFGKVLVCPNVSTVVKTTSHSFRRLWSDGRLRNGVSDEPFRLDHFLADGYAPQLGRWRWVRQYREFWKKYIYI